VRAVSSERVSRLLAELNRMVGVDRKRVRVARAPGRANLIGEHTDYNEGYVLPCTVDRDILMAAQPRPGEVVLHSLNLRATTCFSLEGIRFDPDDPWGNYPRGVAHFLRESGFEIGGMVGVVDGTVPIGSGMSSSAAVEVVTAVMFRLLYGLDIDPVALAKVCFRAETEFLGVGCGIMDQFISALGRENSALFLDCRTLHHEPVALPSRDLRVVLLNTMVKRLAKTTLNRRKRECTRGVEVLRRFRPSVRALRDVSPQMFEELKAHLPPTIRKRCQHVVYEDERVLGMVEAMRRGDLEEVGRLMGESHGSCRDLYEVSGRELDAMVGIAEAVDGVVGCRMTGAGLGGCTVNLVWDWAVEGLVERARVEYEKKMGIRPEAYVCTIPSGAGEVPVGV